MSKQTGLMFEQLSDEAKEVARTWYRDCMVEDFQSEVETLDNIYNEQLKELGFEVKDISWELSNGQHDHFSFHGKMEDDKMVDFFKEQIETDEEKELFQFLIDEGEIKLINEVNYYDTEVWVDFEYTRNQIKDNILEAIKGKHENIVDKALTEYVATICRDFKKQGYAFIEECFSDERVDEVIVMNEYQFDENGNIL